MQHSEKSNINTRVWFYYRMGKETIQFKFKDTVRGHFCHNDSIIQSITCSMVSFEEFKEALVEIMINLKAYWLDMVETKVKKLKMRANERIIKDFEEIMGLTIAQEDIILQDLEKMNTDPTPIEFDTNTGIRIKIEKDYVLREKEIKKLRIHEEGQLLKDEEGRTVYVIEKTKTSKVLCFSSKIKSENFYLIPYLHVRESLPETIKYHIYREDLVKDITEKNYEVFNRHSSLVQQ